MLDRFPEDILCLITERINDKADLKSLSQVSRLLYQHTLRPLYRSVTIRAINEHDLVSLGLSILVRSARHLRYVKDLQVKAPFHNRLRSRCPDSDDESEEDLPDEDEDDMADENWDDVTDEDEENLSRDQSDDEPEDGLTTDETDNEIEYNMVSYGLNDGAEEMLVNNEGYDGIQGSELGSNDQTTNTGWGNGHRMDHIFIGSHASFLRHLESRINPFLRCLTEGSLQSFSWNLGTCIPRSVVDYLSNKQTQITSLTITTDITCGERDSSIHRLGGFSQLRHISWTTNGIAELETLGAILLRSAAHLQEIKISCGDPHSNGEGRVNQFVKTVLRMEPGSRSELFPALRRLALFGVSFEHGIEDIISAFRIPQLQFLQLQDCFGTNQMLDWLATFPQAAHLTSFELNFTGHFVDQYDIAPLTKFLRSFQGLEDLFVLYPREWTPGPEYWSSVSHHHTTLRRVVHQQTDIYGRSENDNAIDGLIGVLGELERIRYLGTCSLPGPLSTLLAHAHPRPKLRLLHIRPRGWVTHETVRGDDNYRHDLEFSEGLPKVEEFSYWAFGPNGLPDLEILAYGDFSFQGRQPNILLCRSEDEADHANVSNVPSSGYRFRELKKQDIRLQELVQDNTDFLEACPEDYLLHQW